MSGFRLCRALFLVLLILSGVVFSAQAESMVTFRGEIDYRAEDSCRGMVLLWSAEMGSSAVVSTNLVPEWSAEVDSECRFEIKAAPGSYYLQVVIRQTPGPAMGPLQVGDLLFSSAEDPQVSGNAGDQLNLGTLTTRSVFNGYTEQVETGIIGRLVDEKDLPIAGLRVLAYRDASMVADLYAISPESDEDGRFALRLAGKSELYLQARQGVSIGLPPLGFPFGIYGGKEARRINVEPGKTIEGVEIVVAPRKAEKTDSEN